MTGASNNMDTHTIKAKKFENFCNSACLSSCTCSHFINFHYNARSKGAWLGRHSKEKRLELPERNPNSLLSLTQFLCFRFSQRWKKSKINSSILMKPPPQSSFLLSLTNLLFRKPPPSSHHFLQSSLFTVHLFSAFLLKEEPSDKH